MKQLEKRQLARLPLGQVPRGALTLLHQGLRTIILELRDISNAGISFSLNERISESEKISVEFTDTKVKLEVFGRVAWCRETSALALNEPLAGKYLLGVELLSPMLLYAVLPKR